MHTNVLELGFEVAVSPNIRGLGFGMDFEIVLDPIAAKTKQAVQSFNWSGAFGTFF